MKRSKSLELRNSLRNSDMLYLAKIFKLLRSVSRQGDVGIV